MRRGNLYALGFIVLLAAGSLAGTLLAGNVPQLGLDLQGGALVVLRPEEDVRNDVLNQSIEIIRNRVDSLGVAEPDISRLGDAIVVQLPGVRDQDRALDIVGQTAELRFRPVLQRLGPPGAAPPPPPAPPPTLPAPPAEEPPAEEPPAEEQGAPASLPLELASFQEEDPSTPREQDDPAAQVVLPELDEDGNVVERYLLGPAELTGSAVDTARAQAPQGLAGAWEVIVDFTGEGSDAWAQLTTRYVGQQIAIVLDGVVQSAPTVQEAITGGTARITGDFSEREAKDLALVLRFGALPVELVPQEVRRVSATLGTDSLEAGLIAGAVGVAMVLLYILFYYRALGLVVVVGLCVWGSLQWSVVALLGATGNLALTLAGAVGIIVSVGVTVDSYIVYFERLKDEIRSGKTIRSSVDRGFASAFRTIRTADISSLIGASLLYFLTVGPVRGFAFFLGLATVLDLVVAWFFTRPMVGLLARSRLFTEARWVGVARGLAAAPTGVRS
jgi:preprotein translocase subunit SecD